MDDNNERQRWEDEQAQPSLSPAVLDKFREATNSGGSAIMSVAYGSARTLILGSGTVKDGLLQAMNSAGRSTPVCYATGGRLADMEDTPITFDDIPRLVDVAIASNKRDLYAECVAEANAEEQAAQAAATRDFEDRTGITRIRQLDAAENDRLEKIWRCGVDMEQG